MAKKFANQIFFHGQRNIVEIALQVIIFVVVGCTITAGPEEVKLDDDALLPVELTAYVKVPVTVSMRTVPLLDCPVNGDELPFAVGRMDVEAVDPMTAGAVVVAAVSV